MNHERAKELLPVYKNFADGGEIQARYVNCNWFDDGDPTWEPHYEYRIKPQEGYVRLEDIHDNDGDLDMAGCIKMREVI